jgi:hypothetical protein
LWACKDEERPTGVKLIPSKWNYWVKRHACYSTTKNSTRRF